MNHSKYRKDSYINYNHIKQHIQSSSISLKESSESNDFRPKYTGNNWTTQARNTRIYSAGIRKRIQEELGYVLEKVQRFIRNRDPYYSSDGCTQSTGRIQNVLEVGILSGNLDIDYTMLERCTRILEDGNYWNSSINTENTMIPLLSRLQIHLLTK